MRKLARIALRPHHQLCEVSWRLCICNKNRRAWREPQFFLSRIRDDTDNLHWIGNCPANIDSLPDGIFAGEELLNERFVNNRHAGSFELIAPAEIPPGRQRR